MVQQETKKEHKCKGAECKTCKRLIGARTPVGVTPEYSKQDKVLIGGNGEKSQQKSNGKRGWESLENKSAENGQNEVQ